MDQLVNKISPIVESQFPSFYKEEGPLFIEFVKLYYKWMEQEGGVEHHTRNLQNYFDIDKTIDDFVLRFKEQYLPEIELTTETDRRVLIKHAKEFLASKGTDIGVELLFKLVYGEEAYVFHPNDKVLRPSDGTWFEPKYLELSRSEKTISFVGKNIVGSISGATAFAERLVTKNIGGKIFDVLYITNNTNDFITGELITSDGLLDGCPTVVGSMTTIDINGVGKDFAVGDEVEVVSQASGRGGVARVTATGSATGRVLFDILDGGYGFTNNAIVYVSDKVANLSKKTSDPRSLLPIPTWPYKDFLLLEDIEQPMETVNCISVSAGTISVNTRVFGYYANNALAASGYVIGIPSAYSSGNQTIKVLITSGSFTVATAIGTQANAVTGIIDVVSNTSAIGVMVGTTNTAVGIANVQGSFTSNTPFAYVRGLTTNTYANVSSLSTGTGANFDIGQLTNTERVYLNTDRIIGKNTANVAFLKIPVGGGGSNVGFIDDVFITHTSNTTYPFISGGGTNYTNGQNISFTGGTPTVNAFGHIVTSNGVLRTIAFGTGGGAGTLYSNNQNLVFTGSATTIAAGYITTNNSGAITSITITNPGKGYATAPTITISGGTTGTAANLVATIANGVIIQTGVDTLGSGYDGVPTVSVNGGTTGAVANLIAHLDSGYGFPKDPNADLTTVINNALTRQTFTIGSIYNLTNINLGTNYNQDPFVAVIEPGIAGFGRRDIIVGHDNLNTNFVIGESLIQQYTESLSLINYTNLTIGNDIDGFELGEAVTQGTAEGVITEVTTSGSTTGSLQIRTNTGTFAANSTPIVGVTTNTQANVSVVGTTQVVSAARGVVKSVTPGYVVLRRRSFNTNFVRDLPLVGSTSGVTANVLTVAEDPSSMPIGFNASITARAGVANGVIESVQIIDSGFAYKQDELVELRKSDNPYIGSGFVNLLQQGEGQGYFTTQRGFLSDNYNYLHDNDYWQEYAYEVRVGIPLARYADVLKRIGHTAGSKFFGSVEKVIEVSTQPELYGNVSIAVEDAIFNITSSDNNTFNSSELLTVGGSTVGFVNGAIRSEFTADGYVSSIQDNFVYIPAISIANSTLRIRATNYDGTSNTTSMFVTPLSNGGMLPLANTVGQLYTNTVILTSNNIASIVPGSIVLGANNRIVEDAISLTPSLINVVRNTTATYRNSNNLLSVAAANVLRPDYSNSTNIGIIAEPARTNYCVRSEEFTGTGWTLANASLVDNDINSPMGVQTADKLRATAVSGVHEVKRVVDVGTGIYTVSIFFRPAEYTFGALTLPASRFGTDITAVYNLTTGEANVIEGAALKTEFEVYADGWIRVGLSAKAQSSGTGTIYARIAQSNTVINFLPANSTSGLHIFGMQFENGLGMTTYIPTTTSVATRSADVVGYNSSGWDLNFGAGHVVTTTSVNMHPNPTDLFAWVGTYTGNNLTLSRDNITSPVGNTPLKAVCTGGDPYTSTFIGVAWNEIPALNGTTWVVSVYSKASVATTGELYIFGADVNGNVTSANGGYYGISNKTLDLTTSWQRYDRSITFNNPAIKYIHVRLDGPNGVGQTAWWDGMQIERGTTPSQFNSNSTKTVIIPATEIKYQLASNAYPLYTGLTLAQENNGTQASGNILFANATTVIVTTDFGQFTKYNGQLRLANVSVLTCISNTTSNAAAFTVGANVTQVVDGITKTGIVHTANATHLVIKNTSDIFTSSTNATSRVIEVANTSHVAYVVTANTVSVQAKQITVRNNFANCTHIVVSKANTKALSNSAHNAVAQYHTMDVRVDSTINKLRVSEYTGNATIGSTLVGSSSNASATIVSIER